MPPYQDVQPPSASPPGLSESNESPGGKQDVVVMVREDHQGGVRDVVSRLRSLGMDVHESGVRPQLGVITGACDASQMKRIQEVEGVEFVRAAQTYYPT